MDFLHKIEGIVIMESVEGRRILAQYYPTVKPNAAGKKDSIEVDSSPWGSLAQQTALEQHVFDKIRNGKRNRANSSLDDVILYDGHTILFEEDAEVIFFVIGGAEENEVVLSEVLKCLQESILNILHLNPMTIDVRTLLENFDVLTLILDEMIDDGVILEIHSSSVVSEVMPFAEESSAENTKKALNSLGKYIKNNL